jgi:hypothetical protein
MSISYPLSLPTSPKPRTLTYTPWDVTPSSTSPFTLKDQLYEYSGKKFRVAVQYPPVDKVSFKAVRAFLLSLYGSIGTFTLGDPANAAPLGSVPGTPLANGTAAIGASTFATKGWTAGQTNILRAGDEFQVDSFCYTNLKDVNSDGSGNATLDVWPTLHSAVPNNSAITTTAPKSLWRLEPNSVSWSVGADHIYEVSFSAVEAI